MKIAWTTNVGKGYSSVIIAGHCLYTMGHKNKKNTVFCLDARTGQELWTYIYPSPAGSYPGPRATPLVDGYLYGIDGNAGRGLLKCIELATGRQRWARKTGFGSLMAADGKLIVLNEWGNLFIAQASQSRYQELSSAENVLSGVYWTPPVLCRGMIYCRNDCGNLVCIDMRMKKR